MRPDTKGARQLLIRRDWLAFSLGKLPGRLPLPARKRLRQDAPKVLIGDNIGQAMKPPVILIRLRPCLGIETLCRSLESRTRIFPLNNPRGPARKRLLRRPHLRLGSSAASRIGDDLIGAACLVQLPVGQLLHHLRLR